MITLLILMLIIILLPSCYYYYYYCYYLYYVMISRLVANCNCHIIWLYLYLWTDGGIKHRIFAGTSSWFDTPRCARCVVIEISQHHRLVGQAGGRAGGAGAQSPRSHFALIWLGLQQRCKTMRFIRVRACVAFSPRHLKPCRRTVIYVCMPACMHAHYV